MKRTLLAVLATTTVLGACQRQPKLETRTFAIQHLEPYEVEGLIGPYVYERENGSGTMSSSARTVTVRETEDNLSQIARVLEEYDVARPDIRLHFQLIEADGFTARDERIAAVEDELRRVFQFGGYRLAGEAFVSVTDNSEVEQDLGSDHMVGTHVFFAGPGTIRLEGVHLWSHEGGDRLTTTVNVRPGQTLVLGSASQLGEDVTLLLTVRAEEVAPGS